MKRRLIRKEFFMELKEQREIDLLIGKFLEGIAEEKEISDLENWLNRSAENKIYFSQIKNIWDASGKKQEIDVGKAHEKIMGKISERKIKVPVWHYWQKISAILFLPLLLTLIGWVILSGYKHSITPVVYNEIHAIQGTRSEIKLADGSLVWLNSGSSLKYPTVFAKNERVVYLKGEAYFEVHSNKKRPFIVQTNALSVEATGTKFNVKSFKSDPLAEVTLIRGKVFVNKMNSDSRGALITELSPDQHLEYNKTSDHSVVTSGDAYKYIAWKDGKLIFRNEPLSKVVKILSHQFNVDIELQGKELQKYRYRATFENESLDEILKLLKLTAPIDFREIKRKPLPDGTFSGKKIIIFPLNKSSSL